MANKFNLEGFAVDEDNVCTADGGFVGDVTGDVTGTWFAGSAGYYIADGTISLEDDVVILDSANATTAMQIGSPFTGKRVTIFVKAYTEVADVDFTQVGVGSSTATFSAAGESITLIYVAPAAGWVIIGNNGAVIS